MKKMKKVLSLVLAMVMILSLGTSSVQAAGRGQDGWSDVTYGASESVAEAPAEAPAEEPAVPAEESEEPAAPAEETPEAAESEAPAEEAPEAAEPEAPAEEAPEAAEPEAPAEEIEVPAEEAPVEAAPAEEQAPAEETTEETAAGFGAGEVSSSMSRGSEAATSLGTALTLALPRLNAKAGESGIAKKTVLDTDGDGIYELALSVTGQSTQTTTSEVQKQNVVIVIDVSGNMNNLHEMHEYKYNSSTYGQHSPYYARLSNGEYTEVEYDWHLLGGSGWYSSSRLFFIDIPIKRANTNDTVYYGITRLDSTKEAAKDVVDTLLAYNTDESDMFEISVVKFANKSADTSNGYNGTAPVVQKSTNANNIKTAIDNLQAGGGTNWEAALQQAMSEADGALTGDNEKTSIIFMTDGFPTFYGNDSGNGGESPSNVWTSYTNARQAARDIVGAGYTLYNVFAFGNNDTYNSYTGYEYLCGLTNYAYGTGDADNFSTTTDAVKNYCFNAQNKEALLATFKLIASLITSNVGYAGVSVTDGVSLGATSTSVVVNGQAKAESMRYTVTDPNTVPPRTVYTVTIKDGKATFVIYNADGTVKATEVDNEPETVITTIGDVTKTTQVYSVTVGEGENAKTYKMSPATIEASDGMVKWDLSGLGILENYTYTVAFDVWPNQKAYDIAADLNNGIYSDIDAALTAYGVTDATERANIKKALHKNDDGSYSIYTNYEQSAEYYPATAETDENGNVISVTYGGVQTPEIKQPDPIPLQGSSLKLRKVWDASLSSGEVDEYLWEDGNVGSTSKERVVDLYVWKADTEAALWQLVDTYNSTGNTSQAYIHAPLG